MEDQLRVGLIGAGPWATTVHAPGIADHPGTRLTAVWARRRDAAAELAGRYGAEVADDPDQLIDQVDAVAVAVPPAVQADLALRAARAGKHLLLEKPLAGTVEDARRIAGTIADNDLASLVMLTLRFSPEVIDWLAELGKVGGWTGGSAQWLSGALLGGQYSTSQWRHDQGALFDVGPHAFDLLDAALGPITEVIAAHKADNDLWHLILSHENDVTSTATLSMRLPTRPTVVDFAVYGSHGHRALGGRQTSAQQAYTAMLDDFVAMVHSGVHTHACDAQRGLRLQTVLDQAIRKLP
ncbi:Gfo/Idh/MocA family protein [Kutzneria kofuensis]|uniref:Putative dehydrogenase n=1 Tax=Kutzneria kofuensis TaxID=103725 RepID=A0A7W9KH56_9PSEU|nr:Gfo/Idh/MocA family oxidoreductase [Kutzneria kofuensis]MBB5892362.1 putative dehydrogenase [Kutzneria kofuensis]